MKKFFAFLLMAAALVACTGIEQPEPVEEPNAPKTYTMTVKASKTVDTKALSLSGKTLNATWTEDDVVKVYNSSSVEIGTLLAKDVNADGTSCTLNGTLTTPPSANELLTLKYLTESYGTQDGTLTGNATSIDKVCDCAVATVHASINGSSISISESSASFTNQQAIVMFTLKQKVDNSDLVIPAATALTVNDGTNDYTVTPTSATNVLFVAIPATGTVNLSTTFGGISYSYEKTGAGLLASKYYEITVKMNRVLVNLASITGDITLMDGDIVTGTLASNRKISIAAGATVTLSGVNINGSGTWTSGNYAGLTCLGDATIILKDGTDNTVKGFYEDYPGIHVSSGFTLTINGTGALTASSNGWGAGIGGGYKGDNTINCGNIIISGGTITATGGQNGAGIGSGIESSCGDITISGGTVTATGGQHAAGIGSGCYSSCGGITIESTVTSVTTTKGSDAPNSIGAGYGGTCGTVAFGSATVYNGSAWSPNPMVAGNYGGLTLAISTTTNTDDTWTLTPISAPASVVAVDLGLPSGTLWASCNVGATNPEDPGDYFAWGEVEPYYSSQDPITWKEGKTGYNWTTYKYGDGNPYTSYEYEVYKYTGSDYSVLQPEDDAATANWGSDWCMPTYAQWEELLYNCNATPTELNNKSVYCFQSRITGFTDKCIYLPAAGFRWNEDLYYSPSYGYWSSTLYSDPGLAYSLVLGSSYDENNNYRYVGASVRPVRAPQN